MKPTKPHVSWNAKLQRWELTGWLHGDIPKTDFLVCYGSLPQAIEWFGRIYALAYN